MNNDDFVRTLAWILTIVGILAVTTAITFSIVNWAYGHGVHQGTGDTLWTCWDDPAVRWFTIRHDHKAPLTRSNIACKKMVVATGPDHEQYMFHLVGYWDAPCWEVEGNPCDDVPDWAGGLK